MGRPSEIEKAAARDEQTFRKGVRELKAKVRVKGLAAISRNNRTARELMRWREELVRDLGGEDSLSAQRLALVEMATRTRLLVDHCDAWLLEQPTFINRRKRALFPIVRERQALVDSLARVLTQLGLEKQAKPVEDLDAFLARRAREKAEAANETAIEEPIEPDHHRGDS